MGPGRSGESTGDYSATSMSGNFPYEILIAWHERHVNAHLDHVAAARDHTTGSAGRRLEAVLAAYALISQQRPDGERPGMLHRGEDIARAQRLLPDVITELIANGAHADELRDDIAPMSSPP